MRKLIILLVCGLTSCTIYKGAEPTQPTKWVITKIDSDNTTLYTYFATPLDDSFINTKPTWFVAPAKSFKLYDTIGFTPVCFR